MSICCSAGAGWSGFIVLRGGLSAKHILDPGATAHHRGKAEGGDGEEYGVADLFAIAAGGERLANAGMGRSLHLRADTEAQLDQGLCSFIERPGLAGGLAQGFIGADQLRMFFLQLEVELRWFRYVRSLSSRAGA